eukprot:GHVS01062543.1.p1 GENE.GHVS01062543.1~~GHVS01062543.1.p1  ORF type:complete len:194 (-),score=8.56 GHVS01062543.1:439-1020(-)
MHTRKDRMLTVINISVFCAAFIQLNAPIPMDEQTSLCDQHRKKAEKFYDKTKEELKIFAKQRVNKLPWNVLSDVKSGLERDDAVKKCTFVGSASPLLQLRVKGYYTIACDTKIGAQIPTTPQHVKGFVFEEKPWSDSVSKTYFMCRTDEQGCCSKRIVKFVRVIYYWETRPCDIVIQTKFYHVRRHTFVPNGN